jgi:glyoxylase-like metal-dependent hydrolase (beta-lactamase superfamily II)
MMRIADRLSMAASLQFGLGGPFDCHVYALRGEHGVVLIDAGAGNPVEPLLQNVAMEFPGQAIVALLLTHAHLDHCGGASQIRRAYGCKVIAPAMCRQTLESGDEVATGLARAREQGMYPAEFKLRPCLVDQEVGDQEKFAVAGMQFTALHVRGHSPDAFCYYTQIGSEKWLFAGDTVFYGGVLGVINAEGSGMEGYRQDLPKLGGLGIDGLFPGHGIFTLRGGQLHIDCAIQQLQKGFLGRQVGQGDLVF